MCYHRSFRSYPLKTVAGFIGCKVATSSHDAISKLCQPTSFMHVNTQLSINTLIACDSDYEIMTANDINDNNEIVGEALVQKPFRNAKGEIVTDSNGEEVLVDTVIAVKLSPTGGSPVECELSDVEIADSTRQGASLSFFGLVGLLAFGIARRLKYR